MGELVPLTDARPAEMNALLAHEHSSWLERLGWDQSDTAELIRRALRARTLTGFGVREGGRITAYAYYVMRLRRSLLGSVHALPAADAAGAPSRLLERCVESLIEGSRTRRIESQFIHLGQDDPSPVFAARGFTAFPREYLQAPLSAIPPAPPRSGATLRPFREADQKAVAGIIYRGFIGSVDARMSECYATTDGCRGFVEGILSNFACGMFEARASFTALRDGQPVGVVLTTRIASGVGHIVQISVLPRDQGHGVGDDLLSATCSRLRELGYSRLSLSVSVENQRARSWYLSRGMTRAQSFTAYVWSRPD